MKILVLFAHPKRQTSVVQRAMLKSIDGLDGVTIADLYAEYPDLDIDVPREQQRLLAHDLIVLQHLSTGTRRPPSSRNGRIWCWRTAGLWPRRNQAGGPFPDVGISAGGSEEAYRSEGRNRFSIAELLTPFNQTAFLCSMAYLTLSSSTQAAA